MKLTKALIRDQIGWVLHKDGQYYFGEGQKPPKSISPKITLPNAYFTPLDSLRGITYLNPFWGRNIFGLAYNYRSLVGEREVYDEPLIFLKTADSACPNQSVVPIPQGIESVWVEVEQVVIVGRQCRRVSEADAPKCIYGYTIGSDITAANVAGRDHHLARSKALPYFAPTGPWIAVNTSPGRRNLSTTINGKVFQQGNTSDRILNDAQCLSLLSHFYTLYPGDLIFTGTPAGAMESLVKSGDTVCHEIQGLGRLTFTIE